MKFYEGWTFEDIRKLTVEEWNEVVEFMNEAKKEESRSAQGKGRRRPR